MLKVLCSSLLLMSLLGIAAQCQTVVFQEPDFPAADSAAVPEALLRQVFPDAQFATAADLHKDLAPARLLVLPYGSAFPESAWADIYAFLRHGGNLVVIGGRPFSRAAYKEDGAWKLRDHSVRYTKPLMIDQYQETPASNGLQFESSPDIPLNLPQFAWKQGFSPIIHLSEVSLYPRGGSSGSIDSNLDALAWGTKGGRRMSAPVIEIDHFRNGFDGGRWIFIDADLALDFYSGGAAADLISKLANQALRGAEEFTVRPVLPLYLPGEPVQLEVHWNAAHGENASVAISVTSEAGTVECKTETALTPEVQPVVCPSPKDNGLQTVTAQLLVNGKLLRTYRSGFWIRDEEYLRSGPKLSVNQDYFQVDGKPLAVIGTTYMSSEVQRLYFDHPNVYVWDRDMRQIHDAGLNMLRTGWWTGWDKFVDENGVPYERTLRTMEAYLMTARKYGLPVQFNIFAFVPDVLGGVNPYLDPEAVRKQQALVAAIAARFHDVPFLAYDLINEPSFSKHVWTALPNGDPIEIQKWNEWLDQHYATREALAAAWNVPVTSVQGTIALPEAIDFTPRAAYDGGNPLKIYDYEMFEQESFANWVRQLREAIRGAGSNQLITVGQDEGGFQNRLSPAFFSPNVDFTTNHSWWQTDAILWDSLVAKQPGKAMLIQETGLQRELNLDSTARRSPENEAALFERKVAMSFVEGSGAIEWLWNTNSYMAEGNEVPIGALRADGTEKPEATVMRTFAKFAAELSPHLRGPQPGQVAIIASQAAQYSAIAEAQIQAQMKSARVLAYECHLTPYLIYENQIDKLGSPRLAILPSGQALSEKAWQQLRKYVADGGNLLITGPIDRDQHWQPIARAAGLIPGAQAEPLTFHHALQQSVGADGKLQESLFFDQNAQSFLDYLHFSGNASFQQTKLGKGQIYWTAYPVELSSGEDKVSPVYDFAASQSGVLPQFDLASPLPAGVMAYPIWLEDSVLYIFVSDDANAAKVDLKDKTTGVRLAFTLPAQHAALALIGKNEKAVIAKYGF